MHFIKSLKKKKNGTEPIMLMIAINEVEENLSTSLDKIKIAHLMGKTVISRDTRKIKRLLDK